MFREEDMADAQRQSPVRLAEFVQIPLVDRRRDFYRLIGGRDQKHQVGRRRNNAVGNISSLLYPMADYNAVVFFFHAFALERNSRRLFPELRRWVSPPHEPRSVIR